MGYLFLLLTVLCESAAVICMKLSTGFQHKWWGVLAIVAYAASFGFITLALKSLPATMANAIWAGASTILVGLLSIFIFGEKLNVLQIISLLFITAGIIGLNASAATK